MKISEIIQRKGEEADFRKRFIFSFEFFPPRTEKGDAALYRAVDELSHMSPDYVSVTYGAGGSTRAKTIDWVAKIKDEHGIESVAHLTCVGASRDELRHFLDELVARGIDNVLALRGDPPAGDKNFKPHPGGFSHAEELVRFIREGMWNLSIGVAGYPEKHLEAANLEIDIMHLEAKIRAGADIVITQLFFDNQAYFNFLKKLKEREETAGWGATGQSPSMDGQVRTVPRTACSPPGYAFGCPVVPGIMPVTKKDQLDRFVKMCGASIPEELRRMVVEAVNDKEVEEKGIAYATEQVWDLLQHGAPGIHFYTLNKSTATRRVMEAVRERLQKIETCVFP